MLIGVIGDTHGDELSFKTALDNFFHNVDLIIHTGDILNHGPRNKIPENYNPVALSEHLNNLPVDILFCKGNCDSEVDEMMINLPIASPYLYLMLDGIKIIASHGDKELPGKFYKYTDIIISGHTHNYSLEKINTTIYLNPGSSSIPKNHVNGTCAIVDLNSNIITIYDITNESILSELRI
jgi:putative phosphoesterase